MLGGLEGRGFEVASCLRFGSIGSYPSVIDHLPVSWSMRASGMKMH